MQEETEYFNIKVFLNNWRFSSIIYEKEYSNFRQQLTSWIPVKDLEMIWTKRQYSPVKVKSLHHENKS